MKTTTRIAILTLGLTAALAGCSGDSDSDSGSTGSGELDGVSIAVGSKDFTENQLLGSMFAQALAAKGASVDSKVNLGGTVVNRKALLSGDIDVYPEYNGTGWTVHLEQQDPSKDPAELTDKTAAKDLAENKIKWVGRTPFNDTYGFAANGDLAKSEGEFDLQKMADYLKANSDAKLCMESEFPNRVDGLVLFEKATGFEVPAAQQSILDTGLIYTETAKGSCQFGEVFTTDGRITALNLSLVQDPGVFILYNASYTIRDEVYSKNASTYDALTEQIFKPLDNKKMAELNAKVDVDGDSYEDVAKEYLEEIGVM